MKQWIILIVLLGLSLTACGGTTPQTGSGTQPETISKEPFTLDQLVATDPGTVELAAGKVQLVEFFAYW
ncbi:MAG: hypothetical protein Fur0022_24330 [Anaerolineales bacterium]